MPINRTNQKMQARSPGLVLQSGTIFTGTGGAVDVHNGDPGVVVTKTGTGLYEVTFPAEGSVDVRDAHAECSDTGSYTQREWSGDGRTLTIQTLNGAPGGGGGGGNETIQHWEPADAAAVDEITGRAFFAAPSAGTVQQVTVTLEAALSGAGQEPRANASTFLSYGDNSASTFPTDPGTAPVFPPILADVDGPGGNLAVLSVGGGVPISPDEDRYSPLLQNIPYSIPFSPFAVAQGDIVVINTSKPVADQVSWPNRVYTLEWTPAGGGGGGGGAPTDFENTIISYHVWLKNSSAR